MNKTEEYGDIELQSKQFGALPIINHYLKRLKLDELLKNAIDGSDRSCRIQPHICLQLVVQNLLHGRKPLYEIKEWATEFSPHLLNMEADQLVHLNDDRIGRDFDRLFDADRASLQTNIVLQAIREFKINVTQLHNDSTTITFTGKYKDANGDNERGKKTLNITNGHNKDHRPDLKQLLWILTVTSDGAVPIHYRVCDGNTTDDTTHVTTWKTLRMLLGSSDFIYVADCKLCVSNTLKFIAGNHGKFITVLPHTRKEDQWFRKYVTNHKIQWEEEWVKAYSASPRKRKEPEQWRVIESPVPSAEGFPIFWVWNSTKEKYDQESRQKSIEKAVIEFKRLETRLQKQRCRIRSRDGVIKEADKILQNTHTGRWVKYEISEEVEKEFRQEGRGRPGPNTRYVAHTIVHFHVSCHVLDDQVRHDAFSDGMFPLITNCSDLSCRAVLEKYKYQPRLEKRHEQLKSVYNVTPVWLNSGRRIEAFLFLYFVALLIQSLIERDVRLGMEACGLDSIPIYPEDRECRSPTSSRILGLFEHLHCHELIRHGERIKLFQPKLNEVHRLVLELLRIPEEIYQPS